MVKNVAGELLGEIVESDWLWFEGILAVLFRLLTAEILNVSQVLFTQWLMVILMGGGEGRV
jgi:hypothetical protein